jgi:hypothetical protein
MHIFRFLLKKLNGEKMIMNKIGCFKMFGMLNFHGLSLWWKNKGSCIKLDAKFVPK